MAREQHKSARMAIVLAAVLMSAALSACGGSVEGEPDDGKATTLPVECAASTPECAQ